MDCTDLLRRVFATALARDFLLQRTDPFQFTLDRDMVQLSHAHLGDVVVGGRAVPKYHALFVPKQRIGSYVVGIIHAEGMKIYMSGLLRSLGIEMEAEWERARFMVNLNDSREFYCVHQLKSGALFITEIMFTTDGAVQATTTVAAQRDDGLVPTEGMAYVVVRRRCTFCQERGEVCACPDGMRNRDLSKNYMRFRTWEEFVGRMSQYTDLIKRPMDAKAMDAQGKVLSVTSGYSRIHHGEYADASTLRTKFLESLGYSKLKKWQESVGFNLCDFQPARLETMSLENITNSESSLPAPTLSWEHSTLTCDVTTSPRKDRPPEPVAPVDGAGAGSKKRKPRNFACHLCGKMFHQSAHRESHLMTVHGNRKDFNCPQCSAEFGTKSNLTRHVRMVHEKVKRFFCASCNKGFFEAGDLRAHTKRKHSEIEDDVPDFRAHV
eukprot:CAMPEP_0198328586 /NCGR_PEP_ID=MMETSP1450-20131203/15566_1 /TAXON_ID=753684 ORGANISM="Madagascaria erythrocladiodes, Strain CCMP3234" /NCGR_SAMPLE_ID=MMETSP1450 /ASSEMBLY_ACC=CAM_ASM_001115 /LENGTH=436 /DNA_ID=CAMNT_0044032729 /DNA_START=201 /DNA_END=1511 /DNA_ORIENTATION=+